MRATDLSSRRICQPRTNTRRNCSRILTASSQFVNPYLEGGSMRGAIAEARSRDLSSFCNVSRRNWAQSRFVAVLVVFAPAPGRCPPAFRRYDGVGRGRASVGVSNVAKRVWNRRTMPACGFHACGSAGANGGRSMHQFADVGISGRRAKRYDARFQWITPMIAASIHAPRTGADRVMPCGIP